MGRSRKRTARPKPPRPAPTERTPTPARRTALAPLLLLAILGALAYANSLRGPFVFDDRTSIVENFALRRPLSGLIEAARDTPLAGRPVAQLSFALNLAAGGLDVYGYHVVNVLLHVLSALTLYGIVRRTLRSPSLAARFGSAADALAFATAAIWMIHPLNTDAVDYLTQRTELLMGLFYLLTLYAAIRAWDDRRWAAMSIACCALGMASKEVMVSAPVLVVLYDRAFRVQSLADLRPRRALYAGLAATWIVLAALVLTNQRGGSVGYTLGLSAWEYARAQCWAILRYLQLAFWPAGLTLDYGDRIEEHALTAALGAVIIAALVGGTLVSWRKYPPLGFLGAWFFLILAPTSSILPIVTEPVAERRMYLPLAALVSLTVAGAHVLAQRRPALNGRVGAALLAAVLVAGTAATARRNQDYATVETAWRDIVRKRPQSPRGHQGLCDALSLQGRHAEATVECEEALRLRPEYPDALNVLGATLMAQGRDAEAVSRYEEALRLYPGMTDARVNLGVALAAQDKIDEAVVQYREALRSNPLLPKAHYNLANALARQSREDEAVQSYLEALRIDPLYVKAHNNVATLLAKRGQVEEARRHFVEALRIDPEYAPARKNLDAMP